MAWELLAIWAIVIATIIWFMRDEKRRGERDLDRKARHFATAPAYRFAPRPETAAPPAAPQPGAAELQRRFAEELRRLQRD
jgi:hypothetical protein